MGSGLIEYTLILTFFAQDHPNAVKLHEAYDGQHNYYLVMECCDGGELFEHIAKGTVSAWGGKGVTNWCGGEYLSSWHGAHRREEGRQLTGREIV